MPSFGIIPAYAGSTYQLYHYNRLAEDHPRLRGEHLVVYLCLYLLIGIIPAYAGSTRWRPTSCRSCQDHPRLRGEHMEALFGEATAKGSSPLTRGAQSTNHMCLQPNGIIPAYAGSTSASSPPSSSRPDHPRLRGEHWMYVDEPSGQSGSSPLTRGAPYLRTALSCASGIIPAYAGSTSRWRAHPKPFMDHPRC